MVYLSWRLGKPPCTVHIFIPTILILALFRKKGRVFLRCRAKTGHARRVSALATTGRQPVPRQPLRGAHEARERYAVSGRQPVPRHPFHGATELRSNTPFPGGGFRALRSAGERRSRAGPKRVDNLRFSTLLGSSPFPFGDLANGPYGPTS